MSSKKLAARQKASFKKKVDWKAVRGEFVKSRCNRASGKTATVLLPAI